VSFGSTATKCVPSRSHLYSSIRRNIPHDAPARFRELPGEFDQLFRVQILNRHQVVFAGVVVRELMEEVSTLALQLSAAEPHLFEAIEVDGRDYWDGLFSKNPPIVDFMDAGEVPNPDEIWLTKINPTERKDVPQSPKGSTTAETNSRETSR
jgi:predicted acylesterase/phospholipase RssA